MSKHREHQRMLETRLSNARKLVGDLVEVTDEQGALIVKLLEDAARIAEHYGTDCNENAGVLRIHQSGECPKCMSAADFDKEYGGKTVGEAIRALKKSK